MVNVRDELYDPYVVMGQLNSALVRAFWLDRFYDQRQTFPKVKGTYLKELPILRAKDLPQGHGRSIRKIAQRLAALKAKSFLLGPQGKEAATREAEPTASSR